MINMELTKQQIPQVNSFQPQQPIINDTFSNSISTINPNISLNNNNNNNIYSQPAFQPIEVPQSPHQRRKNGGVEVARKMSIFYYC